MLALIVLLDLGLRKSELGGIMVRDFDLSRRVLTVFGKGRRSASFRLRGRIVLAAERYMLTELPSSRSTTSVSGVCPQPDDYLLYPEWRKGGRSTARTRSSRCRARRSTGGGTSTYSEPVSSRRTSSAE